jgi:glycosidase
VRLDELPEEELIAIRAQGFDAIWLMGVWRTGPAARRLALGYPELRHAYERLVSNWEPADVDGSPYAIAAYEPTARMGGREALRALRSKLHAHGLGLMLDFVPNHVGIDHAWLDDSPDRLVRGTARDLARDPGQWFVHTTRSEDRVFAHGRDPYFPAWTDTAQVDFRRAAARAAVIEALLDVAAMADGLRCDMAMLALPEVFARTWGELPDEPAGNFWGEAIPALRREFPDLALVAEVYWGLGPRLLADGFDWVYDKDFRDSVLAGDFAAVRRRITSPESAGRALFLENHDEERAVQAFGPRASAAAVALYGSPGLRLLLEGQITGATHRVPVQMSRNPEEPPQEECARFYHALLRVLDDELCHAGSWRSIEVFGPSGAEEPGVFAHLWTHGERTALLVANLDARDIRVAVRWPASTSPPAPMRSERSGSDFTSRLNAEGQSICEMDLPAYGVELLRTPG